MILIQYLHKHMEVAMKYKETLNWILDKLDENGGTSYGDDEKYKVNLDCT